jgi:hypothetical protein
MGGSFSTPNPQHAEPFETQQKGLWLSKDLLANRVNYLMLLIAGLGRQNGDLIQLKWEDQFRLLALRDPPERCIRDSQFVALCSQYQRI